VRELHRQAAAVLPLRFGAMFDGIDGAARSIRTRTRALAEGLALVRGKEQMTVRVTARTRGAKDAPEAPAAGRAAHATAPTGTQYLQQRAAAMVPDEVRPLLEAVGSLPRSTRVEAGRTAGVIATVYHLIERGSSDDYLLVIGEARAALPHLSIRVTGPSPCYAFA